jgi:chaperone LolA
MMREMYHRRNLHAFLAILGILFYTGTVQADARGSEVIAKLQKKFADLETLSAHFVKQHYWRVMDQHQEVKGKLLVQRPNQFRMDSDVQIVVSDGKTVWHYAPANAQVLVSDYTAMENDRTMRNCYLI